MPNLELTHDQLQELFNYAVSSEGKSTLSWDFIDTVMDVYNSNLDNLITEILDNTDITVKKMLLTLLEPVAYRYKMSEGTDMHFINLILSLEQEVADFEESMTEYEE